MTVPGWLPGSALSLMRVAVIVGAACLGWVVQGWHKDAEIATLKKNVATATADAANARADQAIGVLVAERKAHDGLQAITDKFTKESDAAKNEKDAFIAGVRSGAIRLSIPVARPVPAGASCTDAATAGSTGDEARADLTPAAAEFLDGIASEGDAAIRQANSLIDAYNKVREELNVQTN